MFKMFPPMPPAPSPADAPYIDPAEPILRQDTSLDDNTRAEAWSAFHQSKNAAELLRHLGVLQIPDSTKRSLIDAKSITDSTPTPVDKAADALRELAEMDPNTLSLAEKHKSIAKALIDAVKG
jgi:hypothetical protein